MHTNMGSAVVPLFDDKIPINSRVLNLSKAHQSPRQPDSFKTPKCFRFYIYKNYFQGGFTVCTFNHYTWRSPVTFLLQQLIDVYTKM